MRKMLLLGCVFWAPWVALADSLEGLDTPFALENSGSLLKQKSMQLMPVASVIKLEPLAVEKKSPIEAPNKISGSVVAPLQVGLRREIPQLHNKTLMATALNWAATARGGQIAAVSIISPDALGLRIGLSIESLPSSATLRFYDQQTRVPLEIHATEVLHVIANNLAAGDNSDQARVFWSPPIIGEEITLEIELPAGIDRAKVQFSLPALSHIFVDPLVSPEKRFTKAIGDSGSCNVNYQCEASQDPSLELQSRAVAKMSFVEQGNSYLCTGTLLNNARQDKEPYFLSANHCISTQAVASTLVTYWLYRANACSGTQLDSGAVTLGGGAQLLYTNAAQDTSFFKLNRPAPSGAAFAGWSTEFSLFNRAQPTVGLHNPAGDLQKVSKGSVVDFVRCTDTSCFRSGQGDANAVEVMWTSGVTEGGSSGSGLFNTSRLIGQLYGGSSSCSNPLGRDQYSLLAPAYEAGLKAWLSPSPVEVPAKRNVVEFYNPDLNHYFITADEGEQRFVDGGSVGRWLRTGQSFKAGGATAACRFYGNTAVNPKTGAIYGPNSHFYTVDQQGCAELIGLFDANAPSWKFESYDFSSTRPSASGGCPAGTRAVHRLYNNGFAKRKASNHRFVTDLSLIAPMTSEGWLHEGVDMCAPL